MPVCFKCRCAFPAVPADAEQSDICVRCLRACRVAAGILAPAEPAPCDPDFAAFRDHIEHGPVPSWGFTAEDFERMRQAKYDALAEHEKAPSDASLRQLRTAERGLRRLQDHNAAKTAARLAARPA